MKEDRIVVREDEDTKKKGWFSRKSKSKTSSKTVTRPPGATSRHSTGSSKSSIESDDLPERLGSKSPPSTPGPAGPEDSQSSIPIHAGFDLKAIQEVIQSEAGDLGAASNLRTPQPQRLAIPTLPPPSNRSESVPLPSSSSLAGRDRSTTPVQKHARFSTGDQADDAHGRDKVAGSSRRELASKSTNGAGASTSTSMLNSNPWG